MSNRKFSRRTFNSLVLATAFSEIASGAAPLDSRKADITEFGAVPDNQTINTRAIQATIDHVNAKGGGTVRVPRGTFVSGALFLKAKVHLHLDAGAVLKCSTDMRNFPPQRTRIEGHFEEHFNPGLINAKRCDGLRITGDGTLDGHGRPIWDLFWKLRNEARDPKNFPNLGVPRARLAVIEDSRDVVIEGVTFKDSQYWNLHLYRCEGVMVRNARFLVPDDYKQAPSTDGIDVDSCRNVTIDTCFFSVTDDCIAAKGTKGPHALEDSGSPPVEHIHVRNCVYKRGGGVFTCGSGATVVRHILVENCKVIGDVNVAVLKLRPDTPQRYEDITFRNITLDSSVGMILSIQPWSQYADYGSEALPNSIVRNLQLIDINGRFGSLGVIRPNSDHTDISKILLKDCNLELQHKKLTSPATDVVTFDHVMVNGKPVLE